MHAVFEALILRILGVAVVLTAVTLVLGHDGPSPPMSSSRSVAYDLVRPVIEVVLLALVAMWVGRRVQRLGAVALRTFLRSRAAAAQCVLLVAGLGLVTVVALIDPSAGGCAVGLVVAFWFVELVVALRRGRRFVTDAQDDAARSTGGERP